MTNAADGDAFDKMMAGTLSDGDIRLKDVANYDMPGDYSLYFLCVATDTGLARQRWTILLGGRGGGRWRLLLRDRIAFDLRAEALGLLVVFAAEFPDRGDGYLERGALLVVVKAQNEASVKSMIYEEMSRLCLTEVETAVLFEETQPDPHDVLPVVQQVYADAIRLVVLLFFSDFFE